MAKRSIKSKLAKVYGFLGTSRFFKILLVIFVVQAFLIALTGRFPMAFDERTHLGIIEYYANHLNPFGSYQAPELNQYGLIIHNPSYIYHYLMSFPWRIITALTDNFMAQIILMRAINIALFSGAIVIFRKLLLGSKFPKLLINLALLFFIMTPLVSQVAAQINYDSLFMLIVGLSLILTLNIANNLKRQSFKLLENRFLTLAGLLLTGTLVKYAFLPIILAIIIYLGWKLYKASQIKQSLTLKIKSFPGRRSKLKHWAVVIFVVLSFGLFLERYGGNIIRYGSPIPGCSVVLGEKACLNNTVIERNANYLRTKPSDLLGPAGYTDVWIRHMGYNLMFALNGPHSGHKVGLPLPLPKLAATVFGLGGLVLSLVFWRRVFASLTVRLLGFVIIVYVGILWLNNYLDYLHFGQLVAVQGRYLIPVLILVYVVALLAYQRLFDLLPRLRTPLTTIAVVCFLAGGGTLTYILRSDPSWYWENNFVVDLNEGAQKILRPIIPE